MAYVLESSQEILPVARSSTLMTPLERIIGLTSPLYARQALLTCTRSVSILAMLSFSLRMHHKLLSFFCAVGPPSSSLSGDDSGHTYYFNICGNTGKPCAPKQWTSNVVYGPAVRMWGDVGRCDLTDPKEFCRTIGGEALCCSKPCQALGTGAPQVQVLDPSNPAGGGIQLHYEGVRAHEDDPH